MKLSERRVRATINYLIAKGIAADRLISAFEGEFKLVNDCKCEATRPVEVIGLGNFRKEEDLQVKDKCPEDEHQLNRRTEFTFRLRQKSL